MEQLQSHIWGRASYEELRKYLTIYEEAFSHVWLCNCSTMNFLIRGKFDFPFFISVATRSHAYLESAWRNSCSPPCPWAWSRQSVSPAPGAWSRPGRWAPSPVPRRPPPPSSPSAGSCTPYPPPAHQPRTIGAAKKMMSSAGKGDFYYSGLVSCTKWRYQTLFEMEDRAVSVSKYHVVSCVP